MKRNKRILFSNLEKSEPYNILVSHFDKACEQGQSSIDAIAISSFNTRLNEVSSRFVNLKYIIGDEWIFFSNYKSHKAEDFESHDQISALIFWNSINIQIRIKADISKSSKEISDNHFRRRSKEKNSLAISSKQSNISTSFQKIEDNFYDTIKSKDLFIRPDYWGGYSFKPYEIEFWKGHKHRLNKRDLFVKKDGFWDHYILQP